MLRYVYVAPVRNKVVWPGCWGETVLIVQALKMDGRHHAQIRLNRPSLVVTEADASPSTLPSSTNLFPLPTSARLSGL